MGKRGPKKKPKKILENRGSRALETREGCPDGVPGTPKRPRSLDADERKVWDRVVPRLEAMGVLCESDEDVLIRYCADFARWEKHWRYAAILETLMETLPLGWMAPDNSVVSRGYCLCEPGSSYLVYQPQGGKFTLDLPPDSGKYHTYWIDPRTGAVTEGESAQPGPNDMSCPAKGDWALLVTFKPRSFDRIKTYPQT